MFDFSVDRKRNALAHVCDLRGTTVETRVMVAKSMQPQDIFYCDAVMVANMFGPDNELVVCVVSDSLFLSCFAS